MILARIANTSYNSVALSRLSPEERVFLKEEQFASLDELVKKCNPRERYVLIKDDVVLDPGDLDRLQREVAGYIHCVASVGSQGLAFEDEFFSVTGNAIKECEGNWGKLISLGYPLIKISEENKHAENYHAEGPSCGR